MFFCSHQYLWTALKNHQPPIEVSEGVVKTWWNKHRVNTGPKLTAEQLNEQYGDIARTLAAEHTTSYRLTGALQKNVPPIFVTDAVARQWMKKYLGDVRQIEAAGHLESLHGHRIRADLDLRETTCDSLAAWLLRTLHVQSTHFTFVTPASSARAPRAAPR